MQTKKTFLSYLRTDSDFAIRLAKDLREARAEIRFSQPDSTAAIRQDASDESSVPAKKEKKAGDKKRDLRKHLLFGGSRRKATNQGGHEKYFFFTGDLILIILTIWFFISCGTEKTGEKKAWESATGKNDSTAYTSYLEEFPEGPNADSARIRIEFIIWNYTVKINDSTAYASYLQRFPNGPNADSARIRIEFIIWTYTVKINDSTAYASYLQRFPIGPYADSARKKIENIIWSYTVKKNDSTAYASYLQRFPNGFYADKAKNELKRIKMEIPPPSKWERRTIPNQALFKESSTIIMERSFILLDNVVQILNSNPDLALVIECHSDAMGSERENLLLTQKRAESVKTYLVKKGVSANRISVIGSGESRPVASNRDKEGRAKNNRTELILEKMRIPPPRKSEKITISNQTLFIVSTSIIVKSSFRLLDNVSKDLMANPGSTLLIECHSDTWGFEKLNLLLTQKRAESVKAYLVKKGISAKRIGAIGRGESKPIASKDSKEGRARNNRTELTVTK